MKIHPFGWIFLYNENHVIVEGRYLINVFVISSACKVI